jgi:REP element-mobilizing transposase RayT
MAHPTPNCGPPANVPSAYLLTFSCRGSWLPGDPRGSVDRDHRAYGTPVLGANPGRLAAAQRRQQGPGPVLDESSRTVVLRAVRETCQWRGWELLACHVRSRHVHVVVRALQSPERITTDLKSYATRGLRAAGGTSPANGTPVWGRHGSMRYLWCPEHVEAAVHYVVFEQGEPMAVYCARPDPDDAPRRVHGDY